MLSQFTLIHVANATQRRITLRVLRNVHDGRVLPVSTANQDINTNQSPHQCQEVDYPERGGGD